MKSADYASSQYIKGFALPVKAVFEVCDDSVTVITAYLLKRKKV